MRGKGFRKGFGHAHDTAEIKNKKKKQDQDYATLTQFRKSMKNNKQKRGRFVII